jgi:hypothetical protein
MGMARIEIYNPVFYGAKAAGRLAAPPVDLRGKRVGLWNSTGWRNFAVYLDHVTEMLAAEYGATVVRALGPDAARGGEPKVPLAEAIDRFTEGIDVAVMGLAA